MPENTKVYEVVIVDDHPLFRKGIATILETQPDLHVCGEAAAPQEALTLILKTRPDVALLDLHLQMGSGLDLTKSIKAQGLSTKILIISAADEALYARRCLQAGASGFLAKIESSEKVVPAIRKVLRGDIYVGDEMAKALLAEAVGGRPSTTPHEHLTDRELQMLTLYGEGMSTSAIAGQLHLSPKTVATHRASLMKKLGLKTNADLIEYALRHTIP